MMLAPQLPKMLLKNPIFLRLLCSTFPLRAHQRAATPSASMPTNVAPSGANSAEAQPPPLRFRRLGVFGASKFPLHPRNSTIQSRTILKKKLHVPYVKEIPDIPISSGTKKTGSSSQNSRWNENVLQVASLYACDHFKKDLHECCFPFQ